ncbi:MAG: hypothetical protein P9F19_01430 [Candidatus Contendobacter sp.]|nr:hypothetical protein [Candidatus Contendobacter sp.]MDG4556051.1 hypothetical protein [Candidatus Contendobacter sp.]
MANRFARKTGNWNASDVWSDTPSGTAGAQYIPGPGDVAMANSYTVTVNVDSTCAEVRTDTTGGATTGGRFTLADGVTLTANPYAGSTICVYYAGSATANVVGNVNGGTSSTNAYGANNAGAGTLNVTGNASAGSAASSVGVLNSGAGNITVSGNVAAGTSASTFGASNTSSGNITISGVVYGSASAHGVQNSGIGTITIDADAIGGSGSNTHGAYNSSTGTIIVNGEAVGGSGSNSIGAYNASLGTMRVAVAVGNNHGPGYSTNNGNPGVYGYGTNSGGQPTTTVGAIRYGAYGQSPTSGRVLFDPNYAASATTVLIRESTLEQVTFTGPDNTSADPDPADVRHGTSYRFGQQVGTCHVPPAGSVAVGVPVDDETGTAVLSGGGGATAQDIWEYSDRTLTSGGGGGGGATAQEVWEYSARTLTDKANFTLHADYDAAKTAASQASVNAVPTAPLLAANYTAPDNAGIASTLAAVNALHDFDPASDTVAHVTLVDTVTTLTNSPDVPSESEIATAVWEHTERTLSEDGGGASPTEIADAVRDELAPELASITALETRLEEQVPTGPVVVLPAPGPGQTVAWTMCYDEHGAAETGVVIQIKLVQPAGAGLALDGAVVEAVSDGDGLVTVAIPRGAGLRFSARRWTEVLRATWLGRRLDAVQWGGRRHRGVAGSARFAVIAPRTAPGDAL